jgi:hypothetical protein
MLRMPINVIRGRLPLPPLLKQLLAAGRWKHPGEDALRRIVPFIQDPLCFLTSHRSMLFESGPLMGPNETENALFCEYRGSAMPARDLPWIDVEQTLFVIVNERPGDDVGIALDFRTGKANPRVVAGDWHSKDDGGLIYREVAPTFPDFAWSLGFASE